MFCENCGMEMELESKYCEYCGAMREVTNNIEKNNQPEYMETISSGVQSSMPKEYLKICGLVLAAMAVILFFLISFRSDSIVGTWSDMETGEEIQFTKDGYAVVDNVAATYSTDGNNLIVSVGSYTRVFEYELKGSKLYIYDGDDMDVFLKSK